MTSMPEVAAEWQNFDQLTADKLYELLRFRHDLCDRKKFLELGCTIPGTIDNPFLAGNRKILWGGRRDFLPGSQEVKVAGR
ncbi:MAG TPA: hypothetical protein VHT00_18910 [Stellaceae bacterium]|nr:hypothetical protein [Stellaceae bacterium]